MHAVIIHSPLQVVPVWTGNQLFSKFILALTYLEHVTIIVCARVFRCLFLLGHHEAHLFVLT